MTPSGNDVSHQGARWEVLVKQQLTKGVIRMNSYTRPPLFFQTVLTASALILGLVSFAHAEDKLKVEPRTRSYISGNIDVKDISQGKPISVVFEDNVAGTQLLTEALTKIGYKTATGSTVADTNAVTATVIYFGKASDRPAFGTIEGVKVYGDTRTIGGFNSSTHWAPGDVITQIHLANTFGYSPVLAIGLIGQVTGVANLFNGLFKSKGKEPIVAMIVSLQTPFSKNPVYILVESMEKDVTTDEMLDIVIEKAVWVLAT
jgi:hypothetical protein